MTLPNKKYIELMELIETDVKELNAVRKEALYYKAWKNYGFTEKTVDQALDILAKVSIVRIEQNMVISNVKG